MNITRGKWSFRPKITTSILTLLFLALFVRLGVWQLERAEYKALRHANFTERQQQAPVDLGMLLATDNVEDMLWRKTKATGRFDETRQILLDNRVIKGAVGYFVYTPFRLQDENRVVLVNRGWVEAPPNRNELPALISDTAVVELAGELKAEPRTGIMLADVAPEEMGSGIYRVQKIELEEIAGLLGEQLLPLILRLGPDAEHGYKTVWQQPGSDEQKHRGYAFQWFAFATTLLVLYVVLNTRKKKTKENL